MSVHYNVRIVVDEYDNETQRHNGEACSALLHHPKDAKLGWLKLSEAKELFEYAEKLVTSPNLMHSAKPPYTCVDCGPKSKPIRTLELDKDDKTVWMVCPIHGRVSCWEI